MVTKHYSAAIYHFYEELELSDPRLDEWKLVGKYLIKRGDRISIRRIEAFATGRLFDRSEYLAVFLDIKDVMGNITSDPTPSVFERTHQYEMNELPSLFDYVRRIIGGSDLAAGWEAWIKSPAGRISLNNMDQRLTHGNGPGLTRTDIDAAADIERFTDSLGQILKDQSVNTEEIVLRISAEFRAAYRLGRRLREVELKALFEADAENSRRLSVKNRAGGIKRGAQITAASEQIHAPVIEWIQTLIDNFPSGKRLTYSALADIINDKWPDRPFVTGPSEPYEARYLSSVLLPKWRKAWPKGQGGLKWPGGTRMHGSNAEPQ